MGLPQERPAGRRPAPWNPGEPCPRGRGVNKVLSTVIPQPAGGSGWGEAQPTMRGVQSSRPVLGLGWHCWEAHVGPASLPSACGCAPRLERAGTCAQHSNEPRPDFLQRAPKSCRAPAWRWGWWPLHLRAGSGLGACSGWVTRTCLRRGCPPPHVEVSSGGGRAQGRD